MKRRKFLSLAAGTGTAVLASGIDRPAFAQGGSIRWGTTQVGSGAQITLSSVINVVDVALPELRVREQLTSGPIENIRLLRAGDIEIAGTTSADAYNGYFGQRIFSREGPSKGMRGMFCLYPANCTLAVAKKSSIHSIADLKGKRIAIGPAGTGVAVVMEEWLKAFGIGGSGVSKVGYRQGADYLRTGAVDAVLVYGTGDKPVEYLQELEFAMELRILGWDIEAPEYKKLKEAAPEMASYGTFSKAIVKGLDKDLIVPTIYSAEYSNNKLSEDTVYKIIKAVWDGRQKIAERANLGAWMGQHPSRMLEGLLPEIPLHPGAAKFYKEKGVLDAKYQIGDLQG